MLLLSERIRQCRAAHRDSQFQAVGFQNSSYAAHMGFFQAFGLNFGNEPGEASGNASYLPIRFLEFDGLLRDAALRGDRGQDEIERHAQEISQVLARQSDGELVDTLAYSFREILRNALEHSGSDRVGYCAQYWRTRRQVELAVIDSGCGIRASLARNPNVELNSDRDALLQSLLPGVSGRLYSGVRERRYDVWQNSGFGLFMTSRLCGRGGSFLIVSGDTGLFLADERRRWYEAGFQGTVVRALLATDRLIPLREALASFRQEGDRIAAELGIGRRITASHASRMLSRDFPSRNA